MQGPLPMRLLTPALLLTTLLACAVDDGDPSESQTGEIVGGVAANGAGLDAVGALGRIQPDGTFKYYCTATLVAPQVVLTAKHCVARAGGPAYTENESIYFGIGANSKEPKRIVKLARTWMADLDTGGFVSRGADVAVATLDEPVLDVAPLPVLDDHVGPSAIGGRVSAVGYGVRDIARSSGLRRAGTLTIQATEGAIMGGAFASADELVDFARTEAGDGFSEGRDEPRLRQLWERSLLERYELFAGIAPGDVQPCSGDSGGPLLARTREGLGVIAVVSGSFKLSNSFANPCSVLGEVYATFPADIQAMIDEASLDVGGKPPTRFELGEARFGDAPKLPDTDGAGDRCGDVPVSGICEGHAAVRCISEAEGPRRLTHIDCGLVMQTCRAVEGPDGPTAECVDP